MSKTEFPHYAAISPLIVTMVFVLLVANRIGVLHSHRFGIFQTGPSGATIAGGRFRSPFQNYPLCTVGNLVVYRCCLPAPDNTEVVHTGARAGGGPPASSVPRCTTLFTPNWVSACPGRAVRHSRRRRMWLRRGVLRREAGAARRLLGLHHTAPGDLDRPQVVRSRSAS